MLYQLKQAYNDNSKLEIMYINQKDQVSQRIIRVLELHEHTVKAYCYKKRSLRFFKIENILSGQLTNIYTKNQGA
ncbi:hypothetical protein [Priestia sp. GS2]|uniref:hypothetical protein n=1 Tax=Priestia sp. GS2 TaxID=3117403 RepID=UPI002EDA5167